MDNQQREQVPDGKSSKVLRADITAGSAAPHDTDFILADVHYPVIIGNNSKILFKNQSFDEFASTITGKPDDFIKQILELLRDSFNPSELKNNLISSKRINVHGYTPQVRPCNMPDGALWRVEFDPASGYNPVQHLDTPARFEFRDIVECLAEAVVVTDLDDVVIFANHRLCQLTGYSLSELLGRPAYEMLLEESEWPQLMQRNLDRSLEQAEVYDQRIRCQNGETKWVQIHAAPLYSGTHDVIGTIGAMVDITRRRQLEDELRDAHAELENRVAQRTRELENAALSLKQAVADRDIAVERLSTSEWRYRTLAQHMHEGLMAAGATGIVNYVNPRLCELVGRTREEIIGQTLSQLDSKSPNCMLFQYLAATSQRTVSTYEVECVRPDGTALTLQISCTPIFDVVDNMLGSIFVITDFTARKQTERQVLWENAKLSSIISVMDEGTIFADKNGIIEEANDFFSQLLGLPHESIVGQDICNIIHQLCPNDSAAILTYISLIKHDYNQDTYVQQIILDRNTIIARLKPIYLDNTFTGILFNAVDVTELVEANRASELAHKATKRFINHISHEFRTPLTVINGYAELLLEQSAGSLNPTQHRYTSQIENSAHHILDLVNDLLELAKIEANQLVFDFQMFDLTQLCRECCELFVEKLAAKNIALYQHYPTNPVPLEADRSRLKQVLINLLGNAYKYTSSGSITMVVEEQANHNQVSVTDTGIGIAESDFELIFEPFEQVHTRESVTDAGTGLGLAIAKEIVEAHRGSISVESTVGTGSTFTVRLPKLVTLTDIPSL